LPANLFGKRIGIAILSSQKRSALDSFIEKGFVPQRLSRSLLATIKTRCAVGENKLPKVLYETAVSRSSDVICHCGKGFLMSKRLLELQTSDRGKSRGLDRREAGALEHDMKPEAT
jgi:hypothetical protein